MVFVDTPGAALGRGVVTAINIATHAVGTGQQGTITLARSFGTVENLSIGSWTGAYGSLGTLAGRRFRGRMLYLSGSLGAGSVPAGRVSVGTLAAARLPAFSAAYVGTLAAPRLPSLSSTLQGTLGAARHQLLQNIPGSVSLASKVQGTLASPRLGTFGAGKTAYGTLGVPRIPQLQSLTGTANSPRLGTFGAGKVAYGTLAAARHQLMSALFGTVPANKWAGSQPPAFNVATKATSGTLARARVVQVMGTKLAGSLAAGASIRRYAVWPVPFPNASYFPVVTIVTGSYQDGNGVFKVAGRVNRVTAGSMEYVVFTTAAGVARIGSAMLAGIP